MTEARGLTQGERTTTARNTIIAAAMEVLAGEGYRRTTFVRIQEVAGISRGLISYHFGSKASLIEAVVESVRDTYSSEALATSDTSHAVGSEAVLGLVSSYLERLRRDSRPATVILVLAMTADADEPEVRAAISRRFAEMRSDLSGWIERGHRDGSISRSVHPEAGAAVIEAIVRGIALQYVVDPSGFDLESARESALAMVRAAIAPAASDQLT